MNNSRVKTKYFNKRGSILVFAVFLLMFFVLMGSVVLRAGEQSINESIRIYRSEQAYYSAKSTVDLIITELSGTHKVETKKESYKSSPFAGLYECLSALTRGGSVSSSAQADVAGAKVDVVMKCTDRQEDATLIKQTIVVTAEAQFDGVKRKVSREIDIETVTGKTQSGVIGTKYGVTATYNIQGTNAAGVGKTQIRGGMIVDNAFNFTMKDMKVVGDLYIKAEQQITLSNIEVTGNVYLYSINYRISLINCSVNPVPGDAVRKTAIVTGSMKSGSSSEVLFTDFNMKNCDLYTVATRRVYGTIIKLPTDKVYADAQYINIITAGNLFTGEEAKVAHEEKFEEKQIEALEIDDLVMPAIDEDKVIGFDNYKDFFNEVIDVSGGKTINYEIRSVLSFLKDPIKVQGEGTVNFYVSENGIFNNSLKIERVDGGKTAVNFIEPKNGTYVFVVTNMTLDANILCPFHKLMMVKSQVRGSTVAGAYEIDMQGEQEFAFDNGVVWSGLGSFELVPPVVTGTAEMYIEP